MWTSEEQAKLRLLVEAALRENACSSKGAAAAHVPRKGALDSGTWARIAAQCARTASSVKQYWRALRQPAADRATPRAARSGPVRVTLRAGVGGGVGVALSVRDRAAGKRARADKAGATLGKASRGPPAGAGMAAEEAPSDEAAHRTAATAAAQRVRGGKRQRASLGRQANGGHGDAGPVQLSLAPLQGGAGDAASVRATLSLRSPQLSSEPKRRRVQAHPSSRWTAGDEVRKRPPTK